MGRNTRYNQYQNKSTQHSHKEHVDYTGDETKFGLYAIRTDEQLIPIVDNVREVVGKEADIGIIRHMIIFKKGGEYKVGPLSFVLLHDEDAEKLMKEGSIYHGRITKYKFHGLRDKVPKDSRVLNAWFTNSKYVKDNTRISHIDYFLKVLARFGVIKREDVKIEIKNDKTTITFGPDVSEESMLITKIYLHGTALFGKPLRVVKVYDKSGDVIGTREVSNSIMGVYFNDPNYVPRRKSDVNPHVDEVHVDEKSDEYEYSDNMDDDTDN